MPTCDMVLQITTLIGCFCCFFPDKTIPKDGDTVSVHYTGKKYAERVGRVGSANKMKNKGGGDW